jgi:hypothetical protein
MTDDRFEEWLKTPQGRLVYTLFGKYAQTWKKSHHKRCPANLLMCRIRWELGTKTRLHGIGIDNDYGPLLARKLVQEQPEYTDFFTFHQKAQS